MYCGCEEGINLRRNYICDYPFTHFEVNNPNGDVTFCCNHQLVLGNVNRQTMAEIWNGEEYQKVRRAFLDGRMRRYCYESCPVLQGWKDYEKLGWYRELPENDPVRLNAELNEGEIAGGKTVLASRPRWLRFAASYRCNLKCYHCFQENDRAAGLALPDKFFTELGGMLPDAQVVFLYGGEPLVEARNLELLRQLAGRPAATRVFMVTNGTIVPEDMRGQLAGINYGLIAISLDAVTRELYEELRAPAQWERVAENIAWWSALTARQQVRFQLTLTINKRNLCELTPFIEYAARHNAIPMFQYAGNPADSAGFRERYEIVTPAEWSQALQAMRLARQRAGELNLTATTVNLDCLLAAAETNSGSLLGKWLHRLRGIIRKALALRRLD